MAAALAYRWDGARTRLYFQTQDGTYNEESLIEFIRELRRHFRGEQVILLWDGLPSHRSRMMTRFLAEQRHWLEVRRLPAYAPELNPAEGALVEPEESGARQPVGNPRADGDYRCSTGSQPGTNAARPALGLPPPHRAPTLIAAPCPA